MIKIINHIYKDLKAISVMLRILFQYAYLLLFFSFILLSSCINEDVKSPESETTNPNMDFYFRLSVATPEASRSATESDGTSEDGTLEPLVPEGTISKAHIYFFDAENDGHLLVSFDADKTITESYQNKYGDIYAKITIDQIRQLFTSNKVNLYVVANANLEFDQSNLQNGIPSESDFLEATLRNSIENTTDFSRPFIMGSTSGMECPMSNKNKFEINLPDIKMTEESTDAEIANAVLALFNSNYRDPDGKNAHLWNISLKQGYLELERSIARVDYGDTRSDRQGLEKHIYKLQWAEEDIYLKLVSMELFNLEKKAYTFRHTAPNQTDDKTKASTSEVIPFGIENNDVTNATYRWVADVNWGSSSNDFFNAMSSTTGEDKPVWSYGEYGNSAAYITTSSLDSWLTTNSKSTTDYVPWFYVMENTVSSTDDMNLANCTGVNFHMLVIDKQGNSKEKSGNDPLRITLGDAAGELEGYYQDIEYSPEKKDSKGDRIEPAGYYLDYRYLIEHNNDSDKSGTVNSGTGNKGSKLAPMQIGVVRNNVYRLSIQNIKNLPQPHEPDNMILEVECVVADWDVRNDDNITLF